MLILESLALAMASGRAYLLTGELVDVTGIPAGALMGALSGMRKSAQRYWVCELRHEPTDPAEQAWIRAQPVDHRRRWQLTSQGMLALVRLAREGRQT